MGKSIVRRTGVLRRFQRILAYKSGWPKYQNRFYEKADFSCARLERSYLSRAGRTLVRINRLKLNRYKGSGGNKKLPSRRILQ